MLIRLVLPASGPATGVTTVRAVHARQGTLLEAGTSVLDFSVDLSAGVAHDCPPISHYRIILRDRAWLRTWLTKAGDAIPPAAPLALLTTDPDETLDADPLRAARITVAGILFHDSWWDGVA